MASGQAQPQSHHLFRFLNETSIKDIPQINNQKTVVFSTTADLNQCFEALVTNHILSAPVVDETTKEFVGLLDMKDFVAYILYLFSGKGHPVHCNKESCEKNKSSEGSLDLAVVGGDLVDYSRRNPFIPIPDDSCLGHAMKEIANRELYRMPVVSKHNNELVGMLSQSTIVQYLVQNKEKLTDVVKQSIQELQVGAIGTTKKVIQVSEDTILLKVFEIIWENKVHGCPVVSKATGQIIGSISVTDLQYCISTNLQYLSFPVSSLLKDFESVRKQLVTCNMNSSLLEVMEKLVEEKVHRIYVVDGQKVIGIITMIDIIDTLLLLSRGQGGGN